MNLNGISNNLVYSTEFNNAISKAKAITKEDFFKAETLCNKYYDEKGTFKGKMMSSEDYRVLYQILGDFSDIISDINDEHEKQEIMEACKINHFSWKDVFYLELPKVVGLKNVINYLKKK